MPQVVSSGGPVIASPRFVPIIFSGDDRTADITGFMKAVGVSTYWTSIAPQYGASAGAALSPIVLTESPPSSISDADIQTWLQGKLDGTHGDFGVADASSVYVIFYPATTAVQTFWGTSCMTFDGYHSQTSVGMTPVVYAVIARCSDSFTLTALTSHELFEATTDPLINTNPAFLYVNDVYASAGTSEIGDLCQGAGEFVPVDVGFPVQRIWSNAASAGGHAPCAPSNAFFFDTVADVSETIQVGGGVAPGITVPLNTSRTVNLVAFSDAPTQGAWTVSVASGADTPGQALDLTLCRSSAENGESIPLTIMRPFTSTEVSSVTVTSTLGSVTMTSVFAVSL